MNDGLLMTQVALNTKRRGNCPEEEEEKLREKMELQLFVVLFLFSVTNPCLQCTTPDVNCVHEVEEQKKTTLFLAGHFECTGEKRIAHQDHHK